MGEGFWKATSYGPHVPYSGDAVRHYSRMAMDIGVLLVAEEDGRVIGSAAALMGPLLGNLAFVTASELFLFVDPQVRQRGLGTALVAELEATCKARGASVMGMMLIESINPEAVASMYSRMGYTPAERTFFKML
jgi:N-acetylglutamate synthase and related acetyltransferases